MISANCLFNVLIIMFLTIWLFLVVVTKLVLKRILFTKRTAPYPLVMNNEIESLKIGLLLHARNKSSFPTA